MAQNKLKILRIIARLNVGGPAIHTILLTEALNNGRFESILVAGQVGKTEKDMIYLAKEKGVRPVIIPELCRQVDPVKDVLALWKIFKLIKRERPDIVHTHTAKAGALGRTAAVLAGVPVRIHTFHGHIFESYFNKPCIAVFLFIERVLALLTKYIVVVSQAQKKEIGEHYKIAGPGKIKVVPLGLELEKLFLIGGREGKLRRELGLGEDVIVVGIVGRLVPVKNHKMFLDAADLLPGLLEDKFKIKYLIIGDGEERVSLEGYAAKLGLGDDAVFCGWREDMADVYSGMDITGLTSFNEGTPVALIEALAAGRPVIATDVGGVADVVKDGINGYLVASGDARAFALRLADLVKDSGKRSEFGLRGRRMVRETFSKERLVRDIAGLYEDAVSS
jgi:glycosyltransferase involved in cell wall biosynthesis